MSLKDKIKVIASDIAGVSYGICSDEENQSCAQIKVENLSVSYNKKTAVEKVSIEINPCSITALVGPSGCGKTSFLNSFNRLTELIPGCNVDGKIHIGRINIKDCKIEHLRKRVGMIFQKPSPFPLSIKKNIDFPLKDHGIKSKEKRNQILVQSLKDVGLWEEVKDRLNHSALELSGGQQQRLCIARALALKPEIILMDEPCSALDPIASTKIEELILKLKGKYTIIIVTHNLAQARRIADHVAFFWTQDGVGKMIEHGPTEQIFERPEQELTALYTAGARG